MTRDDIEKFVRALLVTAAPGNVHHLREAAIKKIVDQWWSTVDDPFQTKTLSPTYTDYLNTLSIEDRWAHCGDNTPHGRHNVRTILFNEGPYPDQVCVGTPLGLRV
jgi:hypothetical protein